MLENAGRLEHEVKGISKFQLFSGDSRLLTSVQTSSEIFNLTKLKNEYFIKFSSAGSLIYADSGFILFNKYSLLFANEIILSLENAFAEEIENKRIKIHENGEFEELEILVKGPDLSNNTFHVSGMIVKGEYLTLWKEKRNETEHRSNFPDFKIVIQNELICYNESSIPYVLSLCNYFLAKYDLLDFKSMFHAAVGELLENAFKANRKRRIYKSLGFDLHTEYEKGLPSFLQAISQHHDIYDFSGNIHESEVIVKFEEIDNHFVIRVKNNFPMHPEEMKSASHRISLGGRVNALTDVLHEGGGEGAGLGLAMLVMMLKNSGFANTGNLTFNTEQHYTEFTITFPINNDPFVKNNRFSQDSFKCHTLFPVLPDVISELNYSLKDFNTEGICLLARKDPGFAMNLLYAGKGKGENPLTLSIKNLPVSFYKEFIDISSQNSNFPESNFPEWNHARRVATICAYLAHHSTLSPSLAYCAGLIHEAGKIAYNSLYSSNSLKSLLSSGEFSKGVITGQHYLGKLLAGSFDLQDDLCDVIENHHRPRDTKYTLTKLVYVANTIVEIQEGITELYEIDLEIFSLFGIHSGKRYDQTTAFINKVLFA